ncbi:MAG: flagellar hook assembly protein FlgD [Proteobacteria bacterium]|nr:flagellar hook assembly protein FlgD [Pseudomonadota bacterium]
MVVGGVQNNTVVTQQKTDAEKASLNYDAFLKLMLQQLKSQDPTNPVDQTQSLAQLASFSNVEQSIKINDKLSTLLQQKLAGDSAALIGKNIESLTSGKSGVVVAVEVSAGNAQAILTDGSKIDVSGGLRITAA